MIKKMELQNQHSTATPRDYFKLSGTVVKLNKQFGFIKVNGSLPRNYEQKDVHFQFSSIKENSRKLVVKDEVEFHLNQNSTQKPTARVVWLKGLARNEHRKPGQRLTPKQSTPSQIKHNMHSHSENGTSSTPGSEHQVNEKANPNRKKAINDDRSSPPQHKQSQVKLVAAKFYRGLITSLNDKGFGFLHPTEPLPHEYQRNDVYFRIDMVNAGDFALKKEDILEFRLGTNERDLDKPMAFKPKVVRFCHRSVETVEQYIDGVKEKLYGDGPVEKPIKQYILDILSCSPVWRAICSTSGLSNESLANLLSLILDLKSRSDGLQAHYLSMLKTISQTPMFNPRISKLKDYINAIYTNSNQESIEQLQKVLIEVLRHVPGKARAVVAMIRPLAESAKEGSTLSFFYALLKEMSRHCGCEIEDMEWNEVPLVPNVKELTGGLDSHYNLLQVKTHGAYCSPHEYMDTYFRLLRADCFDKLRIGIHDLLNGKLDPRDMHVYHSILMAGIKVTTTGTGIVIALKVTPQRHVHNWATCSNLMFGNLLCISLSGKFNDPIWATVSHRDPELLKKHQVILIELCSGSNSLSDSEAILAFTQNSGTMLMAESPTYYKAYQPVLHALQSMDPEGLPFKDQLVYLQPPDRAAFIDLNETMIDGSVIYEGASEMTIQDFTDMPFSLQDVSTTLDNSQVEAVSQVIDKKVAVIQGPPGTGKTFIGVKLVQLLLSMSTLPAGPILVLTYKNHALDEFLKTMVQLYPDDVARIGGRSKEPELENINWDKLKRSTKRSAELFNLAQDQLQQMEDMKCDIEATVHRVNDAKQLNMVTLLEQLTGEQVKQLICGYDWKKEKIKLHSLQPIDTIRSVIKHHLYDLYKKNKDYIPKDDIQKIINRCNSVVQIFFTNKGGQLKKKDVDQLVAKVESKIKESLQADDEITNFDDLLRHVCIELTDKLQTAPVLSSDIIHQLLHKAGCPVNEFLLSGGREDIWHDIKTLWEKAIQVWLPRKKVIDEVKKEFSQSLKVQQLLSENQNQESDSDVNEVTDEVVDEHDIEEEQERLAAIGHHQNKPGDVEGLLFFQNKAKVSDFGQEIKLFNNAKEILNNSAIVPLLNVDNLWSIKEEERVILLQVLLERQVEQIGHDLDDKLAEYQRLCKLKHELDDQHQADVLGSKKMIGMTVTGASINHDLIMQLKPAVILVEEAAEILEPQIVASLGSSVKQLILIGDHKQLRPQVETYELTQKYHFDISLMERLINNKLPFASLKQQNRMRPEFAELLKDIYPKLESNLDRVRNNKTPGCIQKSMFFWDHQDMEIPGRSVSNEGEADRVIKFAIFLLQQGYKPEQITILAAYQGQVSLLRKKMRKEEACYPDLFQPCNSPVKAIGQEKTLLPRRIQIHTIDLFQGDENDIVIISLVRSNTGNKIGFLKLLNRRCVAQSRSRCGLYFVGNKNTFNSSPGWKKLIKEMSEQGCVDVALPLCCPNHKDSTKLFPKTAGDVPLHGFCNHACTKIMDCHEHFCQELCQPLHLHNKCKAKVMFMREECGHYDMCECNKKAEYSQGPCKHLVGFKYESCEHLGETQCYRKEKDSLGLCKMRVMFEYEHCGHTGLCLCHEKAEKSRSKCTRLVTFKLEKCGHEVACKCCEKPVKSQDACRKKVHFIFHQCGHAGERECCIEECKVICEKVIPIKITPCGHMGTHKCNQDMSEVECKEKCTRNLGKCGHPCSGMCKDPCDEDNCHVCKTIQEESQRRLDELKREEIKKTIREELDALGKKDIQKGCTRNELIPEGDTASEYYEVEDRVKRFIQTGHNWFPQVVKVEKITNLELEKKWLSARLKMFDPSRAELKFHGTKRESVEKIINDGFLLPQKAGMYGRGIYFATDSSKSAQQIYTKGSNMLLLCHVLLGKSHTVTSAQNTMNGDRLKKLGFDSLYAKRGSRETGGVLYDEFVVYNKLRALPKYIVHYKTLSADSLLAVPTNEIENSALLENKLKTYNLKPKRTVDTNDPLDVHFRIAESQFLRLLQIRGMNEDVKIQSIDYFINPPLVKRFDRMAEHYKELYPKSSCSEYILAFHGTKAENIMSIVQKNFSLDRLAENTGDRGYFGAGIYFSEFPTISFGYGKKLLLCKVLPGKTYDCTGVMMGASRQVGYDSHRVRADKEGRGEELVIFDCDQILPCYVINT